MKNSQTSHAAVVPNDVQNRDFDDFVAVDCKD
jgi:hypothetical protein